MGDKIKRTADNKRIDEMMAAATPAKGWKLPRCYCGVPATFEVNRWPKIDFYCTKHLPPDTLGR